MADHARARILLSETGKLTIIATLFLIGVMAL